MELRRIIWKMASIFRRHTSQLIRIMFVGVSLNNHFARACFTGFFNEQIPAAEAEVDQILKEAQSTKEARINEAEGQAARFNEIFNEYKKYPLITKQRMFYEAMEELLPDLKVIIDGSGSGETQKILPIEPLIESVTSNN